MPKDIRPLYEEYGAEEYYRRFGAEYRNPHEAIIQQCLLLALQRWTLDTHKVLDLACGSGEVTLVLQAQGIQNIEGIDPFTQQAYEKRTQKQARGYTFEEIGLGALQAESYSLVVCSFALHLVEQSRLPMVCYQLSLITPHLLILTPHKRPHIENAWGWNLDDEFITERVRTRLYGRA
jgi:2-polyprenyl-3-methyl-5-hydroxy-6-metoxy-1,4-benzoquinol methylase